MRFGQVRLQNERSFEHQTRFLSTLRLHEQSPPPNAEVVGLHIGWLLPVHGRSGWQASHESLDNLAGNFVLNAEDVFHRSVEAFSPNMPARDRVNQLNIDSKTSCR